MYRICYLFYLTGAFSRDEEHDSSGKINYILLFNLNHTKTK